MGGAGRHCVVMLLSVMATLTTPLRTKIRPPAEIVSGTNATSLDFEVGSDVTIQCRVFNSSNYDVGKMSLYSQATGQEFNVTVVGDDVIETTLRNVTQRGNDVIYCREGTRLLAVRSLCVGDKPSKDIHLGCRLYPKDRLQCCVHTDQPQDTLCNVKWYLHYRKPTWEAGKWQEFPGTSKMGEFEDCALWDYDVRGGPALYDYANITVRARVANGIGAATNAVTFLPVHYAVPGKAEDLRVRSDVTDPRRLLVTWYHSSALVDPICKGMGGLAYSITVQSLSGGERRTETYKADCNNGYREEQKYAVTGLVPYSLYKVTVTPLSPRFSGPSASAENSTSRSRPLKAPDVVGWSAGTSSPGILLYWKTLSHRFRGGPITAYDVTVTSSEMTSPRTYTFNVSDDVRKVEGQLVTSPRVVEGCVEGCVLSLAASTIVGRSPASTVRVSSQLTDQQMPIVYTEEAENESRVVSWEGSANVTSVAWCCGIFFDSDRSLVQCKTEVQERAVVSPDIQHVVIDPDLLVSKDVYEHCEWHFAVRLSPAHSHPHPHPNTDLEDLGNGRDVEDYGSDVDLEDSGKHPHSHPDADTDLEDSGKHPHSHPDADTDLEDFGHKVDSDDYINGVDLEDSTKDFDHGNGSENRAKFSRGSGVDTSVDAENGRNFQNGTDFGISADSENDANYENGTHADYAADSDNGTNSNNGNGRSTYPAATVGFNKSMESDSSHIRNSFANSKDSEGSSKDSEGSSKDSEGSSNDVIVSSKDSGGSSEDSDSSSNAGSDSEANSDIASESGSDSSAVSHSHDDENSDAEAGVDSDRESNEVVRVLGTGRLVWNWCQYAVDGAVPVPDVNVRESPLESSNIVVVVIESICSRSHSPSARPISAQVSLRSPPLNHCSDELLEAKNISLQVQDFGTMRGDLQLGGLTRGSNYSVCVRLRSQRGWGSWQQEWFHYSSLDAADYSFYIIVSVLSSLAVVLMLVLVCAVHRWMKCLKEKDKKFSQLHMAMDNGHLYYMDQYSSQPQYSPSDGMPFDTTATTTTPLERDSLSSNDSAFEENSVRMDDVTQLDSSLLRQSYVQVTLAPTVGSQHGEEQPTSDDASSDDVDEGEGDCLLGPDVSIVDSVVKSLVTKLSSEPGPEPSSYRKPGCDDLSQTRSCCDISQTDSCGDFPRSRLALPHSQCGSKGFSHHDIPQQTHSWLYTPHTRSSHDASPTHNFRDPPPTHSRDDIPQSLFAVCDTLSSSWGSASRDGSLSSVGNLHTWRPTPCSGSCQHANPQTHRRDQQAWTEYEPCAGRDSDFQYVKIDNTSSAPTLASLSDRHVQVQTPPGDCSAADFKPERCGNPGEIPTGACSFLCTWDHSCDPEGQDCCVSLLSGQTGVHEEVPLEHAVKPKNPYVSVEQAVKKENVCYVPVEDVLGQV